MKVDFREMNDICVEQRNGEVQASSTERLKDREENQK